MKRTKQLWLWAMAGWGCTSAAPAEAPSIASEAQEALAVYRHFCSLCPRADGCGCLTRADFEPQRWTEQAGPYLRALREYYECQLSSTLAEAALAKGQGAELSEVALRPGRDYSDIGGWRTHCGPHACPQMEALQKNLNGALVSKHAHQQGALLECRALDGS